MGTSPGEPLAEACFLEDASTGCSSLQAASAVADMPRAAAPMPEQPCPYSDLEPPEAEEAASDERACSAQQHQVKSDRDIVSHIRLVRAEDFAGLQAPLQRMQELPSKAFGLPEPGDLVVAVSHAWRNQAHPDPGGEKKDILHSCLEEIMAAEPGRSVFVFLDFLSIPQRPFLAQQRQRTEREEGDFRAALGCMHRMYFLSDRIIHLPWESQGSGIAGEGEEYTVPAACLLGAEFMQTRDTVQVAQPPVGSETISLFDELVCLDAEPVASAAGLEERLAASTNATLRRFSYGLVNAIPADERGWVYLERFITMVKCAMMDEAAAKEVVITSSPDIRSQIEQGAGCLRAAALREKREPGALKRELCRFDAELRTKRFSAASIDKRQMMCSADGEKDRAVVCSIMEEFVVHLAGHWEDEAQRQQGFAKRLAAMVAATEALFGEWDSFSPGYSAMVMKAADRSSWPLPLIVFGPCLMLPAVALPVASPDEPWEAQGLFWFYQVPYILTFEFVALCEMIFKTSRVQYSWRVFGRVVALGFLINLPCTALDMALETALDVFPVPLYGIYRGVCTALFTPLSYFCIEAGERTSPTFRRRLILSAVGAIGVVVICIVPLLLLITTLEAVSLAWQVLVILGFFIVKINYEIVGTKLAKTLGGDAMPVYILIVIASYQISLCFAFTRVSHWLIALETIMFDALENVYYCFSLRKKAKTLNPEQRQYLLASLALRELLEILVPLQFSLIYLVVSLTNEKGFSHLCKQGHDHLAYLALDLVIELAISCLTWWWLAQDGHAPGSVLKGVILLEYSSFFTLEGALLVCYTGLHHAHWGMDWSWSFLWLREGYEWSCGQTWTALS